MGFAYAMDLPLNVTLTLSWDALLTAGERNDGHCLGRSEWGREQYFRSELARLCRAAGIPFAAIWGRDVGATIGSHVHVLMFWPSASLLQLVEMVERVTGSRRAYLRTPYAGDPVARSVCGGWQVDMNNGRDDRRSALDFAEYIAAQHDKHPAPPAIKGKAFGISQAIGGSAQERSRPALEGLAARYAWLRPEGAETPSEQPTAPQRGSTMGKIAKANRDSLGVKVTGTPSKGLTIELEREGALSAVFGATERTQLTALTMQCLNVLKSNEASDDHPFDDLRAFMLSVVRDIAPRDAIERMLAVQMAATHVATIRSARWLAHTENIPQVQAHYTGFNKLARSFAAQMEALRKHRTGGEQKVTVQHVNVSDGGQAIVGDVRHGGRGGDER